MTLRDGKVVYDLNGLARPDWKTLPQRLPVDGRPALGRVQEVMARRSRRTFLKPAPRGGGGRRRGEPAATAAAARADEKPVKKVHWTDGKKPEKTPLFSGVVSYGGLVFIAGIGAHFEGDIKAHTKHVLDEIQKRLESVGSSMEKVLKVNVYLNDLKDYAGDERGVPGPLRPRAPGPHHDRGRGRHPRQLAGRDRLHRYAIGGCGGRSAPRSG